MRQVHATLAGGGQQLLGEERVALRAGDDRLRQRRREPAPRRGQQQGLQLLAAERPQLQPRRHAGAEQARHQPAEPMRRPAARRRDRSQPAAPAARRGCARGRRPGPGSSCPPSAGLPGPGRRVRRPRPCPAARAAPRAARAAIARAAAPAGGFLAQGHPGQEPSQLTGRAQQLADVLAGRQRADCLGDRQVWDLGADQVDASPHQRLRSRGSCPGAELGHQPGLADARVTGHQDRPAPSRRRLPHLLLEELELGEAADQGGVRPRCHRTSMAAGGAGKAPGRRDRARPPPR